ncbi:MAG: hypothetical protein F7C81_00535 [Desulfurococcales archaeon]|nr:hypothetical protein [Desulfurococcales archaeon]
MGVEARLEKSGDRRYKLVLEGEDHTMGALLASKLRSMEEVGLAYYEEPHPLEGRIIVFFTLKTEVDPYDIIVKALESIREDERVFRKLYIDALKEKGVDIEDLQA